MRLRDRPYAGSTVVYAIDGLAAHALDRVRDALVAYVEHPASLEFRQWLGRRAGSAAIAAAADEAVIRVDGSVATKDLVVRARFARFGRLPVRLLVTDDALAIAVNHGAMDGGPILELVTWLVTVASGGDGVRDLREPTRFPMQKGLRKVGRPAIERFRAARRAPQIPPVLTAPPTAADLALQTAQLAKIRLDAEQVARLTRQPAGGPTTVMSRVTSLAICALRRTYRGDADIPVIVPVDSRRFVGNARVLGNFMGVAATASLLASDWSPAAVAARAVAGVKDGTAMVGTAFALARWIARRPRDVLRGSRGDRGPGAVSVFVPILALPKGLPGVAWLDASVPSVNALTIAEWPSGTSVGLLAFGDHVIITAWDESGLFDLGALEQALIDELAERDAAAAGAR